MKFIFVLHIGTFSRNAIWLCGVMWCGVGMVRPSRLVSYASLYTTGMIMTIFHPDDGMIMAKS